MENKNTSTQDRTIDLISMGGIKFEEKSHKYTNGDNLTYTGITTLLKNYEHVFDDELGAFNSAIKSTIIDEFGETKFNDLKRLCREEELRTNKLITNEDRKFVYGHSFLYKKYNSIITKYPHLKDVIDTRKIDFLKKWKDISDEAIRIGSLEHDKREQDIRNNGYYFDNVYYAYVEGKNILNITTDDIVVIPECLVWNHKVKLGGLADIFLFNRGTVMVQDYKTNEEIEMISFNEKRMKGCCNTLMDSNYFHYSLQLRLYQKMFLDLRTDFRKADYNYIIQTASEKYERKEDNFIKCFEVDNEVDMIFLDLMNK